MNSREIFYKRIKQAVKTATYDVQERARAQHRFTSRTDTLETQGIKTRIQQGGLVGVVYLDTKAVPYAGFVHQGTKAHDIFPKNKKALRWAGASGFSFAKRVHHPGTKADPFLYEAFNDTAQEREAVFARYVDLALEEIADAIRKN